MPEVVGVDDSQRDIAPGGSVRTVVYIIYGVGAFLWILLWTFAVGWQTTRGRPALLMGFVATLLLIGMNLYFTSEETVGTYLAEKQEASSLQAAAFPLVVALFSMGTMIMNLDRNLVHQVLPLLMLTLFFAIVLVIPPVWVQTTSGKPTIVVKHVKSTFFSYGLGFGIAAMAAIFFDENRRKLFSEIKLA